MDTMTSAEAERMKTDRGIAALKQRRELAVLAGAFRQVDRIDRALNVKRREWRVRHENPYPEVTTDDARMAMCGFEGVASSGVSTYRRFTYQLKREQIGVVGVCAGYEDTDLPNAALIRLKEAKDKDIFDWFEVWYPTEHAPDPWLVGCFQGKFYKICDWR